MGDVQSNIGHWEHFAHGADIGVRGFGASKAEAFEQAALALMNVIVDTARVVAQERIAIACAAPDDELLLTDWLNALIYEMADRNMLFGRFDVRIQGASLSASAYGEAVDRERHHPTVEVKGATYTELLVRREGGGWLAQTVVDV